MAYVDMLTWSRYGPCAILHPHVEVRGTCVPDCPNKATDWVLARYVWDARTLRSSQVEKDPTRARRACLSIS